MLEFKPIIEKTYMIDPSGQKAEQVIEHRIDPLTFTVASVNTVLGEKAKAFLGSADVDMLDELQEKTKANCPFCGVMEKGTKFMPEFIEGGMLREGDSIAVPNLFSKCGFDSVVIINYKGHVLFPSRIRKMDIGNAVKVASRLVKKVRGHDRSFVHHVVGMNFLHPGGSSVPHPHFQAHVRSVAYSGVEREMRQSRDFFDKTGKNYWEILVEKEKALGERYIGKTDNVEWLAAYAPGHQKEIWGVLPGVGSLAELSNADAEAFGEGISKVISFYENSGTHPFTFAFFSSPEAGTDSYYALHLKICSRPAFKPLYANYDTWFTPKFVGDEVHTEAPENYAAKLREKWGKQ